jgi:putative membrane protein
MAAGLEGEFQMTLSRLLTGAALVALMAQPALAQSNPAQQQQQQPMAASGAEQLAQQDTQFATKAAGDGKAEVKLGKLAQQQAQNDAVKQFGRRMVDDHSKANDELRSIARQKGIDLPQKLPDEAQQLDDELQQKSGHEFDQAYMDAMVEDHQKAVDLFEQEAQSGQDPDLKRFAENTLPTLREHLDLARQTQEQVVAAADQGAASGSSTGAAPSTAPAAASATPPDQQQAMAATSGQAVEASDVIGTEVVNDKGDEVGEIKDLVIDANQVQYAVVGVGGFLGIGEKEVAIPLDRLKLGMDQSYLMSADTEAQLKDMPEYQKERYQPRG